MYRVRKLGSEKIADKLSAASTSNEALMARIKQVNPASYGQVFVQLKHKYNGTVVFFAEKNTSTSKIRQKTTTIRVQVTIVSASPRHKKMRISAKRGAV